MRAFWLIINYLIVTYFRGKIVKILICIVNKLVHRIGTTGFYQFFITIVSSDTEENRIKKRN